MIKFTPIQDLKPGDKVRAIFNDEIPESRFRRNSYPGLVDQVLTIDTENSSRRHKGEAEMYYVNKLGNKQRFYCTNARWLVRLVGETKTSEIKEEKTSKHKPIPEFPVNFMYNPDMMTMKQTQAVEQEAKDQVRSWVLNNYTQWPFGMELDFTVDNVERTIQTKWKESK
jgi:hypothetical protein